MKDPVWTFLGLFIVLAAAVVVTAILLRRRRSESLRQHFGPEYGEAVRKHGDVGRAESELQARRERVRGLDIKRLPLVDADRFTTAWRACQARFVDDPRAAIAEADRLVRDLMAARGYPVEDFEQRIADISVDHPKVVHHYRVAHRTALASGAGEATTEDLRQAIVHYRALFEDLLEIRDDVLRRDDVPRRMEAGR